VTETDVVQISFPWSAVRERVDGRGVVVLLPRERLIELENFCAALRLGLCEEETPPAGVG
jgi:hypothetical protein